jgi:hypothetical protein
VGFLLLAASWTCGRQATIDCAPPKLESAKPQSSADSVVRKKPEVPPKNAGPNAKLEPTPLQTHRQDWTPPFHHPEAGYDGPGNMGYGPQKNPDGVGLCKI